MPTLEALARGPATVSVVLTQPDRPAGRGRKLTASPVKASAESHGLSVAQPARLADSTLLATLGPAPDLMVVIAYGLLLPRWMLSWPRLGCVNLHASLLPRWRGASPIQHAILAGDETTGITLMRMERGLDTGPVYVSSAIDIGRRETAGELHDRLAVLAAQIMTSALPALLAGAMSASAQGEEFATFAPKIAKTDARLDWSHDAEALARRVRAYNPWPIAETSSSAGARLRIWTAEPVAVERVAGPPGSLVGLEHGIDVACGSGVLRLLEVQPPSGRVMSAAAYLAAHSLEGVGFVS